MNDTRTLVTDTRTPALDGRTPPCWTAGPHRAGRQDPRDEAPRAHERAPALPTCLATRLPGGLLGVGVSFALSSYLITEVLCPSGAAPVAPVAPM